jgi:hypothetical protein
VVERRFMVKRKMVKAPLLVTALALALLLAGAIPAFCSGWIFGVRPGSTVESAYFGADMGTITPIFGIDFLGVTVTVEDTDVSASMYIPHFGARVYLNSNRTAGSVVPFVQGTFMKSFASVDLGDGDSDLTDAIGDLLSFYGIGLAFGAEYFFADRFSLGGEYGLRYMKTSAELNVDMDILDEPITLDSNLEISYKSSYAGVSLNFHF